MSRFFLQISNYIEAPPSLSDLFNLQNQSCSKGRSFRVCYKDDLYQLFLDSDQELHWLRLRAEQTGHHSLLWRPGQPAAARHC